MEPLKKLPEGTQLTVGSHNVTIIKYLSAGGFAHIYKVQIDPKEDNTPIACLKRVIVPDKSGLDQLRKEVDVMKKLRHASSVVRYFDSHAERLDSGAYQVLVLMELCPNGSLLDYMNAKIKTKLAEPEILKIMFDISKGVYEMHSKRMIHRDLKIENVLIDPNQSFKLCDFGSTSAPILPPKTQQDFQTLSHDIMYQTTPQYRSPEMIDLYRGFAIDEKADIWALGCFLYKLCYYTTPFEANGDIAILHASYQFPQAPVYSGDLKNLIVIMLQENPFFRPNIVQVIKLVCKMFNMDFKSTNIDDIYKAGSYNFSALHQYQQQRQQEMMQQQAYYQQQQISRSHQGSHSPVPPQAPVHVHPPGHTPGQTPQPVQAPIPQHSQPTQHIPPATQSPNQEAILPKKTPKSTSASRTSSENHVIDHHTNPEDAKPEKDIMVDVGDTTSDSETSLGDIGDLENVEERYPSLENIVPEEDTTKSEFTTPASHTGASSSVKLSSKTSPNPSSAQPSEVPTSYPPGKSMHYPTQPPVLDPKELRLLKPEQLQQYNYQHQVYQYQMNQWLFYQQQQQQQNPPYPVHQRTVSNNQSQLENKEAWEKPEAKMGEQAERLADDIFGSKSRSPGDFVQAPQKTSQSIKSVKSESAIADPDVSDDEEDDFEFKVDNKRLTKSNNSSEINLSNTKTNKPDEFYDAELAVPEPLQLLREEEKEKDQKSQPEPVPESAPEPMNTAKPDEINSPEMHQQSTAQFSSSPILNSASYPKYSNPFPLNTENPSEIGEQTKPPMEPKKSSNPWGEYRSSSQSVPQLNVNTMNNSGNVDPQLHSASMEVPLHQHMNSLTINDERERSVSRKPSTEEPNLIDLEVGLDSSESNSSVLVKPNSMASDSLHSLIDMDFDDTHKLERPHFKKKVSAIPNPSDFRVKEEVIDWASDDENPENNSQMNRLSIRSSLKKQSRKSSEHKRSESASGENRKRLSRLISNS